MPHGDRTGPTGQGPMTGRAMGICAGSDVPGYANPAPGMGMAWGRNAGMGRGRAYRRRLNVSADINTGVINKPIPVQTGEQETVENVSVESEEHNELKVLKEQVDFISKSLAAFSEKLENFEKSTNKAE
jgi:hypothetical protein